MGGHAPAPVDPERRSTLWYATAGWGHPPHGSRGGEAYPLHTRGAYPAILGALMMVLLAETLAVHLFLQERWPWAAWAATLLSVYSAVWLVADYHAARWHPPTVHDVGLRVPVGLRWRAWIPWTAVADIRSHRPDDEDALHLVLSGSPDFWVELREPLPVRGPMGITKEVRTLGIGADDPQALRTRMEAWVAGSGSPEAEVEGP